MKRTSILITGGAGQVGSQLCEQLLRAGHHVICVDNLCTSYKSQIFPLLNHPYFEFIRQDITEPYTIEANAIYHLAYPESLDYRRSHPIETIRTAIIGTLNTLEIAKRKKCPFYYPELEAISCEELQKNQDIERYYTDRKTIEHLINSYREKFGVQTEKMNV